MEFRGYVTSVVFRPDKGDNCILKLHVGDRGYVVAGPLNQPEEGDTVTVIGKLDYGKSGKGGQMVRGTALMREVPQTELENRAFLLSLPSLNKSTIDDMIRQHSGRAVMELMEGRCDIPETQAIFLAKKATDRLDDALVRQELMRTFDLKPALAGRIANALPGRNNLARLQANPYIMAEPGLGDFRLLDAAALRTGLSLDDPRRLVAATKHVLKQAGNFGDTCLPLTDVVRELGKLGIPATIAKVEQALTAVPDVALPERMGAMLSHPQLWKAEQDIAKYLGTLAAGKGKVGRPPVRGDLTDEQLAAVTAAFQPVSVLTGGPGCGKTYTVKAITAALGNVTLCAPTGKAAKRLTESTGEPACTLHALMRKQRQEDAVPVETLLIDESSMVSVDLLASVLEVAKPKRIIFVGDANQLPAVGPGRILGDLIDAGRLLVTRLTKIQRQEADSQIVANAQNIVQGKPLEFPAGSNDFFISHGTPEKQLELLRKALLERIPKLTKRDGTPFDPLWDVQVMAPQHKGTTGVTNLNNALREILNPAEGQAEVKYATAHGVTLFREGDKVLVSKNLYNKGVMNGEVGHVTAVGTNPATVEVEFEGIGENEEDKVVTFAEEELVNLQPGFACTIHKSQGGEAPMVIGFFNSETPPVMRARNLFYTAVTRARERVWLLADDHVINECIRNNRPSERRTLLTPMLHQAIPAPKLTSPAQGMDI